MSDLRSEAGQDGSVFPWERPRARGSATVRPMRVSSLDVEAEMHDEALSTLETLTLGAFATDGPEHGGQNTLEL